MVFAHFVAKTSYTRELTSAQVEKLRSVLKERAYEFMEKQYTIFAAKKGKLNISVYEKGPKILVQGKETEDFVSFLLEPEILGEAELGYEEENDPEMFEPHFGIDESGKGDFFGPLVIAGAYTNRETTRALMDAGIMDSKRITSAAKISTLASEIRGIIGNAYNVICISPRRYNELYDGFKNLNKMLAWGHSKVIGNLLEIVPDCPRSLSDQFAKEYVLKSAMKQAGLESIQLDQRTKGESDIAVAAASILAREKFVSWMNEASERGEVKLALGAGPQVKKAAKVLLDKHGREMLPQVAKMHFKTANEI